MFVRFSKNEILLNNEGAQRQKVKFATKLFSHTVPNAITRCEMLGNLYGYN